jgi:O-acetyl-ADP-ribose deacetylase (regulator of RNase III)
VNPPHEPPGAPLRVVVDDLAFVAADAIVRPVTARLGATTAALRRLELAGGPALARQLAAADPLDVGAAVVTGAGELPVELLVHAVVCSDVERVTRESLRRALASALHRAADFGLQHVAMPPFGLGAGNLDVEASAAEMLDVIEHHRRAGRPPARITVVVESEFEADAFAAHLQRFAA